ncbi:hypothetical protein [Microbacterium suwonense]|uniref:hypothetical protein n=1 Tax=Microbacterium suwonense TaxID=683047 RepID=UPI002572F312|nr:hypothetical protein [Microbacterium suwonense]
MQRAGGALGIRGCVVGIDDDAGDDGRVGDIPRVSAASTAEAPVSDPTSTRGASGCSPSQAAAATASVASNTPTV